MFKSIKNCTKYCLLLSFLAILASCGKSEFKIKGEIYGGENRSIVLEKPDFQGRWIPVDSAHINKYGGFSISFPAPNVPDIYRLALNDQFIYIPVDSTETISLTSSFDKFGSDFNLEGSQKVKTLENFEKHLQKANLSNPDSAYNFKRNVYTNFIKDSQGSIVSFYILTKMVNGSPLYNPADPTDRKYFGAVATGFKEKRPDDPHTAILEQTVIQALKNKNSQSGNYQTITAEETAIIDLDLQNDEGKNVKLSDIVGKGKKVVVIFSLLNDPNSPEFNYNLAQIYNTHKDKVEFYNVSLDADQYAWREAAKNLPWITVYSPGQDSSADALKYNVFQIPAFFIYDNNGELSSRPLSLSELDKSL